MRLLLLPLAVGLPRLSTPHQLSPCEPPPKLRMLSTPSTPAAVLPALFLTSTGNNGVIGTLAVEYARATCSPPGCAQSGPTTTAFFISSYRIPDMAPNGMASVQLDLREFRNRDGQTNVSVSSPCTNGDAERHELLSPLVSNIGVKWNQRNASAGPLAHPPGGPFSFHEDLVRDAATTVATHTCARLSALQGQD